MPSEEHTLLTYVIISLMETWDLTIHGLANAGRQRPMVGWIATQVYLAEDAPGARTIANFERELSMMLLSKLSQLSVQTLSASL
jgi:hypothetical protein